MLNFPNWEIIVVEDDLDSRQLVSKILEHHGIRVLFAANGAECISLLESTTPTLVLTDLAMPSMDGWEVLRVIRANPETRHIPVIAMTAYDSPQTAIGANTAGFDAYFPKPIDPRTFVKRLTQIIPT